MKKIEIIGKLDSSLSKQLADSFRTEQEERDRLRLIARVQKAKAAAKERREKEARKPLTVSLSALAAFKP